MPAFRLYRNVHENIRGLRRALGSVTREISRDDLATLIRQQRRDQTLGKSSIERWENGAEPDIESLSIMSKLAGVSFEAFALGDPSAAEPDWVIAARPASPTLPLVKRKLTDEELDEHDARAMQQRKRAKSKASARTRGHRGRGPHSE